MLSRRVAAALAVGGAGGLAWGWFEAGWVRLRELHVRLPGLPDDLAGIRIAHLSDFHLGMPSRGSHAVEVAAEWVEARRPDLVCITGDLLTHPRGEERLRGVLARLAGALCVLGNHDVGVSRDPFVKAAAPFDVAPARLLQDEAATLELRGRPVQVVGVSPRSYMGRRARPAELVDSDADLRILLCHFPRIVDRLPAGAFDLVLAGHLHDGQITLPTVTGKLRLAHPRFPYPRGLYRRPAATMHVSPGLGTTFVPFRFFARPEATELVLTP
jgi:predicted MPP superfamily phosphohydrolase